MCGINGVFRLSPEAPPVSREEIASTRDCMANRGPDGVGDWVSPEGDIGLGHRRLAIIDLSEAGAQPMTDAEGRYHVVQNGEIYNYRELRDELTRRGFSLRSESDTEVLLGLYRLEGAAMLKRLRGMYAFAIWDRVKRTLLLARDPYGIKPLYYSSEKGRFRFASQVKALTAGSSTADAIEPAGVVGFLLWGSVPEPWTIRRSIRALPAGHFLVVSNGNVSQPEPFQRLTASTLPQPSATLGPKAAIAESVRYHLVADVPVGAFLSAGMDSAVVTSLAAAELHEQLTTLTLRFPAYRGTPSDEGPLAARVAGVLGTRHIEHWVADDELKGLWPEVVAAMDQPSIDGFNTYLVSKIARHHGLKVVLSGLGGDELLGGYSSFRQVPRWAKWSRWSSRVPGAQAAVAAVGTRLLHKPKLRGLSRYGRTLAGAYFLRRALFLPEELPELIGHELASEGLSAYDPMSELDQCLARATANSDWERIHLLETTQYMRNQLLRDSDWASMAHSLELRVPFADPTLRAHLLAAGFEPARSSGKAALLRALAPDLPPSIWRRPKSGFTVPLAGALDEGSLMSPGLTPGAQARRLALTVLREFGVQTASTGRKGPTSGSTGTP